MSWHAFDEGKSIGERGSEFGVIIRDEKRNGAARITLERDTRSAPYAITCGIHGWMIHTRFFHTEAEAQTEFENMQDEVSKIMVALPLETDPNLEAKMKSVVQMISEFVERFP